MQGFARAYDVLVPDTLDSRRTGYQAAVETYLPMHYRFMQELAEEVRCAPVCLCLSEARAAVMSCIGARRRLVV